MKKILIFLCGSLLVVFSLFSFREVFATSFVGKNILKSISILGIGVVSNDSMKFTIINEADYINEEEEQIVELPSVDSNDGMIYTIKQYSEAYTTKVVNIIPYSGDLIEGNEGWMYLGGTNPTKAVTLVADEETGSWWILNNLN